ncbi:hypothetical protein BDN72DRAFT_252137 [Pluteus cervinus]|uniref:Uncharacterized protein n=1 Tax=Pluteus cervinus TaxID=181527 RepID=A0ACD3AGH5_9AGAR|nr:hypothetical protein BDN72DRAFT_252137 [Pluteus cervinus]
MDLQSYQEVDFHKLLAFWATTVLEEPNGDFDAHDEVLLPLLRAIETQLLTKYITTTRRPDNKWVLPELFAALDAWVDASSSRTEKDSYSPWVNLVNCALYLLREFESSVPGVKFRKVSDLNVLLQRNDPTSLKYQHNLETVYRKPDTVFISLATAIDIHPTTSYGTDKLKWVAITKKYAPHELEVNDRLLQSHWTWRNVLFQFEHKTAKMTQQEHRYFDLLKASQFHELENEAKEAREARKAKEVGEELWDEILAVEEIEGGKEGKEGKKGKKGETPMSASDPGRLPENERNDKHVIAGIVIEPKGDLTRNPYIQNADYSIARACSHVSIAHALGGILSGRNLRLSRADRQGVLYSTPINIIRDLSSFMALLFVLQRSNQEEWGEHPELSKNQLRLDAASYTLTAGRYRTPWGITGRQSFVKPARDDNGMDVAAKFSWQPQNENEREHEWLNKAWDALPNDRDHLLQCLGWREYDTSITTTETIRSSLNLEVGVPRRYYVVVLPVVSFTLRQLTGKEWLRVFWDCFKVYFKLWKKGICQGDVTDTNLAMREDTGSGKPGVGVLIDFDYASSAEKPRDKRTGSNIFKSRASHLKKQRIWYDEVESFLWVAVFDSCAYHDLPTKPRPTRQQLAQRKSVLQWALTELENDVCGSKDIFLRTKGWIGMLPTTLQQGNWVWITKLAEIVAIEGAEKMDDQVLYDRIMADVCEPSLEGDGSSASA